MGVSERILAITDTYTINTVVIAVRRFGTSSKTFIIKIFITLLKLVDAVHRNFHDFIRFYLVFL